MAAGQPDFIQGVDFTLYVTQTAAMHNNLVAGGTPAADRGLNVVTTDSALDTPDVPNPLASSAYTKWKQYTWVRKPHSTATDHTPLIYHWNDNATSDATYLKWLRVTIDTTVIDAAIQSLIDDLSAVEATADNAQYLAGNALATAQNALTAANDALTTANNADTNATTALNTANDAETAATNAQTTADTANTTATAAKTTADQAIALVNANLPSKYRSAEWTIVNGKFTGDLPHGLSGVPDWFQWRLKCTDAGGDAGYVQNDEIDMANIIADPDGTQEECPAFGYGANATHVWASYDTSISSGPFVMSKSGTKKTTLDVSKWKAKCTAFKFAT